MPRCLHPDDRGPYVLKSDQHLPEKQRPYFLFRTMTGRQFREAIRLCSEFSNVGTDEADRAVESLYDAVRTGLAGWGNMIDHNVPEGQKPRPIPYDPENLEDVVDPEEAGELLSAMLAAAQLSADDKKKFASRRSSANGSSVRRAPGNVLTRRPK